jgi:hypothetical protein
MAWAHLWLRHHMVWAPLVSTDLAFRLYIAPDAKTLSESASIHERFHSAAAIEEKFRGIEISVLVPYQDG